MSIEELSGLDGLVGEAWTGDPPNGSHVNLVLGVRGTPTAAAIAGLLGDTRPAHAPFLACLGAGHGVRPATVVRNKTPLDSEELTRLTWGALHLGIAQGVMRAMQDELLPAARARDLIVLVSVWIDPNASSEHAVREANAQATHAAINDAVYGGTRDDVDALIARGPTARNDFYRAPG